MAYANGPETQAQVRQVEGSAHFTPPTHHRNPPGNRRCRAVMFGPDGKQIATHQRAIHRKAEVLDLDHYLEILWKRPGGLPGSTALAQARTSGRFRLEHQQFWDTARRTNGDRDGTRLLCEVLLLHRTHNTDEITAGIRAGLAIGSIDPAVIAIEARRSIERFTTKSRPQSGRSAAVALL